MTTLTALGALKARLESPVVAARRARSIADRLQALQALRAHQTALEESERALLPRLQLAELERYRTAADIRMGEAWELAIATSRELCMRLRREADRLAKERAATGRAIVALEGRLPARRRRPPDDGLPTTAGPPGSRPLEAARRSACAPRDGGCGDGGPRGCEPPAWGLNQVGRDTTNPVANSGVRGASGARLMRPPRCRSSWPCLPPPD